MPLLEDYEDLMHELRLDGHVQYKREPYRSVWMHYTAPKIKHDKDIPTVDAHFTRVYHNFSTARELIKRFKTRPKPPLLALRRRSREKFAHDMLRVALGYLVPRALRHARATLQQFQDLPDNAQPDKVIRKFALHVARLSEFEQRRG